MLLGITCLFVGAGTMALAYRKRRQQAPWKSLMVASVGWIIAGIVIVGSNILANAT